jgi:hypothetical protein
MDSLDPSFGSYILLVYADDAASLYATVICGCHCHSPALKNNNEIFLQVTHVHAFAFVSNIRMFLDEQPTHV